MKLMVKNMSEVLFWSAFASFGVLSGYIFQNLSELAKNISMM